MTEALVRCTLRAANGVPADNVQNTFAIENFELGTDDTVVVEAFDAFYNEASAGTSLAVSEFINASVMRTQGLIVEIVDQPSVLPNAPDVTALFDLDATSNATSLPQEVAVCLSFFTADYLTSATPGRERGRVYIGPLNIDALDMVSGGIARPSDDCVGTIMDRAGELAEDLGVAGPTWSIWSRTGNQFNPVAGGWVDNEFDTQRRRGRIRTVRNFWS